MGGHGRDVWNREWPILSWRGGEGDASLEKVFNYATGEGKAAVAWYGESRKRKKSWVFRLRSGAAAMASIAALLPIASQIFPASQIPPAWTTVALALGAGFLGIDRYLGLSSGWMRYVKAEQKIARLQQRFQFDWEERQAQIAGPPESADITELLEIASTFIGQLKDVIEKETDAWILDFKKSLAVLDKALQTRPEEEDKATDIAV
jgi:hypothetical protein